MGEILNLNQFNSIVLQAVSSSQESLNFLQQILPIQSNILILIQSILDENGDFCSQTKTYAMKILTNFIDSKKCLDFYNNFGNIIEKYYAKSLINTPAEIIPFSVDFFAATFKSDSYKASIILNSFPPDNDLIIFQFTMKYVKKIQTVEGFEDILIRILNYIGLDGSNSQTTKSMIKLFNEMLTINPILKFFIYTIIDKQIYQYFFKTCLSNIDIFESILIFLNSKYLFDYANYSIFDAFSLECTKLFYNFVLDVFTNSYLNKSNSKQLQYIGKTLIKLRELNSFRHLPFDQFFINFSEKAKILFFFTIQNSLADSATYFIHYFCNIDQLNFTTTQEDAFNYTKNIKNECFSFLLSNIGQIEFENDNENYKFFERAAQLLSYNYGSSADFLLSTFEELNLNILIILNELILTHLNKFSYEEFLEIDFKILCQVICSVQCFLKDTNSKIRADKNSSFFKYFVQCSKNIYSIYRNQLLFQNAFQECFCLVLFWMQNIYQIEYQVLHDATDFIVEMNLEIPFYLNPGVNVQLSDSISNYIIFLSDNSYFPALMSYRISQKDLQRLFDKIFHLIKDSELICKIIDNLLSILISNKCANVFYALREAPFDLLFEKILPFLRSSPNEFQSYEITKFVKWIFKRLEQNSFPYMSPILIQSVKILYEILLESLPKDINNDSNNFSQNFPILKEILCSIDSTLKNRSINISYLFLYNDLFFKDLLFQVFTSFLRVPIEIICKNFKVIHSYFNIILDTTDLSANTNDKNIFLNEAAINLYSNIILNMDLSNDFYLVSNLFSPFSKFLLLGAINNQNLNQTAAKNIFVKCLIQSSQNSICPHSLYLTLHYISKLLGYDFLKMTFQNNEYDDEFIHVLLNEELFNNSDEKISQILIRNNGIHNIS